MQAPRWLRATMLSHTQGLMWCGAGPSPGPWVRNRCWSCCLFLGLRAGVSQSGQPQPLVTSVAFLKRKRLCHQIAFFHDFLPLLSLHLLTPLPPAIFPPLPCDCLPHPLGHACHQGRDVPLCSPLDPCRRAMCSMNGRSRQ